MGTEITVDVNTITHIDDLNCLYSIRSFYNRYKSWIIFICIVLVLSVIVIIIVLNNNSKPSSPCLIYSSNTMASDVSIECIQYTWNYFCASSNPYIFPSTYSGWWKSSPQGGLMVKCSQNTQNTQCGIGSYGNILIYMQYCNKI